MVLHYFLPLAWVLREPNPSTSALAFVLGAVLPYFVHHLVGNLGFSVCFFKHFSYSYMHNLFQSTVAGFALYGGFDMECSATLKI